MFCVESIAKELNAINNNNNGNDATSVIQIANALRSLMDDKDRGMAAMFANMGVAYSETQETLRQKIFVQEVVIKNLQMLNSSLEGKAFFGGEQPNQVDIDVLNGVYHLFGVLMLKDQREQYQNLNRWINSCAEKAKSLHLLQRERIGGQIDVFGDSAKIRVSADSANALNANVKKKKNQRQLEKEKKTKQVVPVKPAATFSLEKIASDLSIQAKIDAVQAVLKQLNSEPAEVVYHAAAHDMKSMPSEIRDYKSSASNYVCKNLFMKAKKPRKDSPNDSMIWLICAPENAIVDLKALSQHLGYKDELRQANADVMSETLGLTPGSVTPFGLVNDSECRVNVVLDETMLENSDNTLWFHPMTNEASIPIRAQILLEFIGLSARTPTVYRFKMKEEASQTTSAAVASTPAPAQREPLNVSHDEAQARLWGQLAAMGITPQKEVNPDTTVKRPIGHSTHNLFVKAKKPAQEYLVCMRQSLEINMKAVEKAIGAKDIRLSSNSKVNFSHEKGCITPLTMINNTQGNVILAIDEQVLQMPMLRICSGCADPLDHSQHNIVDMTPQQLQKVLADNHVTVVPVQFEA